MGVKFLPVDARNLSLDSLRGVVDLSLSEGLFTEIVAGKVVTVPTKIEDLPYQDTFTSTFSLDVAAALGIPFGAADAKYSRRIFVQEYLKYKDLQDGNQKVRWGVGVRWIVNYKTIDVQAKTTSLALVAASAQVGFVQAEARFQVTGLDSAEITTAIPAPMALGVDSYHELNEAFMKIKGLVWDPNTRVTPQVVAILGEVKDSAELDFEEPLATGWALTEIMNGRTLQQALSDSQRTNPRFEEAVKAAYLAVAKTGTLDARPTADAQTQARTILSGLKVTR